MKRMRLALVAAMIALVGGVAFAEDMDIRALQAQLAAQEARIADLQAKMNQSKNTGEAAKGITSIRKNAVVTLGGTMNARYLYRTGEMKSKLYSNTTTPNRPNVIGGVTKREDYSFSDMRIHDAKLDIKVDINEHVDAFVKIDLHDGGRRANVSGVAQNYWIRWKNICNSGFGILAGRDSLKFGDGQAIGQLDTWYKDVSGQTSDMLSKSAFYSMTGNMGEGMFAYGTLLPAHTMYNWTRTTQITPYWESPDKKFKAEVSFMQAVDRLDGSGIAQTFDRDGETHIRSVNYGVGSMTARVTWFPIEGLKLSASGMNLYNRLHHDTYTIGVAGNRPNNTNMNNVDVMTTSSYQALNLAFRWRPCFLKQLQVFAAWTHGWNEAWIEDQDSDVILYGAQWDFNKKWTVFAQGEYLRVKNDQGHVWHKGEGWNVYAGVIYRLPYGVEIEAGWRHEDIKYKGRGDYSGTHTKFKSDTIYANLGFNF